jgi:hypothetical protein
VAKVGGSIQLLEKEYTRLPSTSVDSGMTRVYQLDNGKAICASFRDNRDINLLDMETMRTLFDYHPPPDERGASLKSRFLCASIDHRVAVLSVLKSTSSTLSLHTIGRASCRWEKDYSGLVSLGAISLDEEKLVIIVSGGQDSDWRRVLGFYVLRASDGEFHLTFFSLCPEGKLPSNIAFTSETQFYTVTKDHRMFSTPPPNEDEGDSENNHDQTTSTISTTPERPPLHPYVRRPNKLLISTTDSGGPPRIGVSHKECCVRKTFSLLRAEGSESPDRSNAGRGNTSSPPVCAGR